MSVKHEARDILSGFVDSCVDKKTAARRLGIAPSYLHDLLKLRRDMPDRVLQKLGFRYDVQIVKVSK